MKRHTQRNILRAALIAALAVCALTLSAFAANAAAGDAPADGAQTPNATVIGGYINVRAGAGTDHSRVAVVSEGQRVAIVGTSEDWYQIAFDGKTGYIFGDYLVPDAPTETAAAEGASAAAQSGEPRRGFVVGGTSDVRVGAGAAFESVAQLAEGARVNILGEAEGWYLIGFNGMTGYLDSDRLFEGDSLPAPTVGEQIAAQARQYLGARYVYGGASAEGFDCSGLTMFLYKQFGFALPHTASGQYASCGVKVARADLRPGDLVFFTGSGAGGRVNHVAVYLGDGQILHARYSVGKVSINSLSERYYDRYYVGAVRLV